MTKSAERYRPGQHVVVTQQIPHGDGVWTTRVTGTVESYERRKTGSWYAHAKDHRLWLDRLTVRKDDGEIVVCNLDAYTRVEVLEDSGPPAPQPQDEGESEPADDAAPENQEDTADAA